MKLLFISLAIVAVVILFLMGLCWLMGFGILFIVFRLKIKKTKEQNDYSFVQSNGLTMKEGFYYSDERKLKTHLFSKATNDKSKLVILSMGSGMSSPEYKNLIVRLVLDGYDVFSFDVVDKIDREDVCDIPKGYQQWIIDLNNILIYIKSNNTFDSYRQISWVGHSCGAYGMACLLENKDLWPSKCVLAATLNSPTGYAQMYYEKFPCFITKPMVYGARAYSNIFYKKYADSNALAGVNSCDIPVLICQGKNDKMLPFPCCLAACKGAIKKDNVQIEIIENGNHNLFEDMDIVEDVVRFIKKH